MNDSAQTLYSVGSVRAWLHPTLERARSTASLGCSPRISTSPESHNPKSPLTGFGTWLGFKAFPDLRMPKMTCRSFVMIAPMKRPTENWAAGRSKQAYSQAFLLPIRILHFTQDGVQFLALRQIR